MHWSDLLAAPEVVTLPFLGARAVHGKERSWRIVGEAPAEVGWHRFEVAGSRRARWCGAAEPDVDFADGLPAVRGYLVEDRLIADGEAVPGDVAHVFRRARPVHLVEPGLPRFVRVVAARLRDGKLLFVCEDFPLGPEPDVLAAYQDRASIDGVRDVTPALHLAFLWHTLRRERAEARRRELERLARETAAREAEEEARRERRATYDRAVRDANARRELAAVDFETAARAALSVGGAELLDVRDGYGAHEKVVQFRFARRRFECVVHRATLRVIDAGICLIDHRTEEHGDDRFTLESLVAVIDEAHRTGQLVVFRHV